MKLEDIFLGYQAHHRHCNIYCVFCTLSLETPLLKVHKIEIFFGFDFEICIISLLVM